MLGEPVGDNETVDARRAARDLAKIREVEAAETQLLKDAELAREVDELRGQQTPAARAAHRTTNTAGSNPSRHGPSTPKQQARLPILPLRRWWRSFRN